MKGRINVLIVLKLLRLKFIIIYQGLWERGESGKNWLITNFLIAHRKISTYMKQKRSFALYIFINSKAKVGMKLKPLLHIKIKIE